MKKITTTLLLVSVFAAISVHAADNVASRLAHCKAQYDELQKIKEEKEAEIDKIKNHLKMSCDTLQAISVQQEKLLQIQKICRKMEANNTVFNDDACVPTMENE